MTDRHLDEALKDLQADLNVTPSPEFAAKVRQRIEQAPATSSWTVWAWVGVAGTCAVAAIIAAAMWRGGQHDAVSPGPATLAEARPIVPAPPSKAARSVPVEPAPAVGATGTAAARVAAAPAVQGAVRRAEPEVLVPPDQLIAIRRLMASVRAGTLTNAPAAPTLIDPETGELIPPKPIEIPLITVDPLPGSPDGKGGGSERK